MMPACTGLPPGELMSNTTAKAPVSSNALRMEDTTNSALASPSEAISPLISTNAVWGVEPPFVERPKSNPMTTTKAIKAIQLKRAHKRERRLARCSSKAEKANFSSTSRSQPVACWEGSLGEFEVSEESIMMKVAVLKSPRA